MTPVPFELPVRPAEAAALADVVFDCAGQRQLGEDLRRRLAGRAATLKLTTIVPWFGSLARDPVHPSAYYLAVDGQHGEPLLLYLAPATAPTSGFYPRALLIGRMRTGGNREIVVNATPFGPGDRENVRRYAEQVNPEFMPRPQGGRAAVEVSCSRPEEVLPEAFEAWRAVLKRTGLNLAAVQMPAASLAAGLWAAIRAGWREGYNASPERIAGAEAIPQAAGFSRFGIEVAGPAGLDRAEGLLDAIRQAKAATPQRSFDFDLLLDCGPEPTTPEAMAFCLSWFKERGRAAQAVSPRLAESGGEDVAERLKALAAVARQFGANLKIAIAEGGAGDEMLGAIARAAVGRVQLTIPGERGKTGARIEQVAERVAG